MNAEERAKLRELCSWVKMSDHLPSMRHVETLVRSNKGNPFCAYWDGDTWIVDKAGLNDVVEYLDWWSPDGDTSELWAMLQRAVDEKQNARRMVERLEAELAAIKARRCDGCKHWVRKGEGKIERGGEVWGFCRYDEAPMPYEGWCCANWRAKEKP